MKDGLVGSEMCIRDRRIPIQAPHFILFLFPFCPTATSRHSSLLSLHTFRQFSPERRSLYPLRPRPTHLDTLARRGVYPLRPHILTCLYSRFVQQQRLDTLAQAGLPIWATELDVQAQDENKRADFYEAALRALYGHPAVEGILFWGFWDQAHWRGENAALVRGDNLEVIPSPSLNLLK